MTFSAAVSWFARRPLRSMLADAVLLALVSGPVAAPFLEASGLFPLTTIAQIIYTMGQAVCPQPEMGLPLAGDHIMAVCMRCYGTVAGLVAMRWLCSRTQGKGVFWLEQYDVFGFAICFIICLAYPLELALQNNPNWPVSPLVMSTFGLVAGLGLGAYIMPPLHSPEAVSSAPVVKDQ